MHTIPREKVKGGRGARGCNYFETLPFYYSCPVTLRETKVNNSERKLCQTPYTSGLSISLVSRFLVSIKTGLSGFRPDNLDIYPSLVSHRTGHVTYPAFEILHILVRFVPLKIEGCLLWHYALSVLYALFSVLK